MLLRRVSFPDFCEPCLPSQADKPPAGAGWLHEIKHDGFRMLVRRNAGGVRLITHHWHQIEWFAQLLCCHPRETEHVQVIHPRSLKTRGLGRAAVSRPQSEHSTASDKHHLR